MPPDRRTWTWQGFAGYWVIAGQSSLPWVRTMSLLSCSVGINTTAWTIGSALLALGLSVGQSMAMVVVATVIIALLAVGAGWPGSHQHIGFTVISRRCVSHSRAICALGAI